MPLLLASSMQRCSLQTLLLIGWLCLGSWSLAPASADESWAKTADGRLIVDLKGFKVGLPFLAADDSRSTMNSSVQLYFPGPHLDILSVKDLMRNPEGSRQHIAEAKYVSLIVWGQAPGDWFNDSIGGITRIRALGLAFGPDANCNSWKHTYRDWRDKSLDKSTDSNGWISQGEGFIRFADDKRGESRYHAVNCDLFGDCRMTVCRAGLTTSFNFNGTGKEGGFRQPIDTSRFDGAIKFAIEKLNQLLLERKADLTYSADE